jgi:glycerol-3-phosphate cytidylyltransferase
MFHFGHLNVIKRSKALGDYLIVGVSTDELVASYKQRSPIIGYEQRAEIIRHLDCVDQVVTQRELFDVELMKQHGVNVMTIGSDWKDKYQNGLERVKDDPGIELVFLPYTQAISTTEIKEAIVSGWQEDNNEFFGR